jgi:hypothetical protein
MLEVNDAVISDVDRFIYLFICKGHSTETSTGKKILNPIKLETI